eukprot:scaffold38700_cov37-Phaeocystis_antarctica.AAC.1
MKLPAHAVQLQASSKGFLAARADFCVHEPRSEGRVHQCSAPRRRTIRPDASHIARVCQDGAVAHRTSSVACSGQPVCVRMSSGNAAE